MALGGVQPVSEQNPGDMTNWVISLARTINLLLQGKANSVKIETFTLRASQTTTTLTDSRLGNLSVLTFMPLTAHGATALQNLWVSNQLQGTCTVNHASSANTDQSFRVQING